MKLIYKETLAIANHQTLSLPVGSQFLSVQTQRDNLCLWYLFDEAETEKADRYIRVIGTGHPIDEIRG